MIASAYDICQVDLSGDRPVLEASSRPLFVVFWWRALPLAVKTYLPDELPLDRAYLAGLAAELLSMQLAARSAAFGGPLRASYDGQPAFAVPIAATRALHDPLEQADLFSSTATDPARELSIVICTRDRPDALTRCLGKLTAQQSPPGQIIVVDNSAQRTAEPVVSGFVGIEYLHEPRAGLSVARNAGIRASRGALVAFTDDDVEPSPTWTAEIARAFSIGNVEAVTGLVLPARLDTPAQCFFQLRMGGLGSACMPIFFDERFFAETKAMGAPVWRVGAGANMAFRRTVFDRIGLFDERLGAGASGCSEDSELWYRLLAKGGACLFEPRACVFHHHREQWNELRQQIRAYMKGHVSALIVQSARFGHAGNVRRIFLQLPAYFAKTAFRTARDEGGGPRLQILADEVAGWFCGLQYAFRPRWRGHPLPPAHAVPIDVSAGEARP